MSLIQIAPPAEEPIGLADLKSHLRVTETAEDGLLLAYLRAARRAVEARGGLSLVAQRWRLVFSDPPQRRLVLPRAPVATIDAVEAETAPGAWVPIDEDLYAVETGGVGRIAARGPWPQALLYRVEFTAGWSAAGAVPEELKLAVRMLAGHFFENREGAQAERIFAVPLAVDALVAPYRQVRL